MTYAVDVPPGLVTVTFLAPADWADALRAIMPLEYSQSRTFNATALIVTTVTEARLVPCMISNPPPAAAMPLLGVMLVITGAGVVPSSGCVIEDRWPLPPRVTETT